MTNTTIQCCFKFFSASREFDLEEFDQLRNIDQKVARSLGDVRDESQGNETYFF